MSGETETLNPCPRCGSDAIVREQLILSQPVFGASAEFIVCCSVCIQRWEWKISREDAIENWNDRNKRP